MMPEPAGLWAVVEHRGAKWGPLFLVKAPGGFDGRGYWFPVGSEDGWGWDQVASWPGAIRLVREGIES